MGQEYLNSEVIPLIEGLRRMNQSDEHGVEVLRGIAHINDINVFD